MLPAAFVAEGCLNGRAALEGAAGGWQPGEPLVHRSLAAAGIGGAREAARREAGE